MQQNTRVSSLPAVSRLITVGIAKGCIVLRLAKVFATLDSYRGMFAQTMMTRGLVDSHILVVFVEVCKCFTNMADCAECGFKLELFDDSENKCQQRLQIITLQS